MDIVLLAGDLLDSGNTYYETERSWPVAWGSWRCRCSSLPATTTGILPSAPYARLKLPENVHIFTKPEIESVELPELGLRVYGAAFTDKHSGPMLRNFRAERQEGVLNILCIHGELGMADSPYNPISLEELRDSGMDYVAWATYIRPAALRRSGTPGIPGPAVRRAGALTKPGRKPSAYWSWETGDCKLETRTIAQRRYELLNVDITGLRRSACGAYPAAGRDSKGHLPHNTHWGDRAKPRPAAAVFCLVRDVFSSCS